MKRILMIMLVALLVISPLSARAQESPTPAPSETPIATPTLTPTPKPHTTVKPKRVWKGDADSKDTCDTQEAETETYKYYKSYCDLKRQGKFALHPGIWRHDDGLEITVVGNPSPDQTKFLHGIKSYPCHATTSTYNNTTIQIWYYGCNPYGLSWYFTFVNGHYRGETRL